MKNIILLLVILLNNALFVLSQENSKDLMVDLEEFKLHAIIKGESSPTVVFENALGGSASYWDSFQTKLSDHTKVVAYDRAGNGKSEISPYPRTNSQMAKELHMLLTKLEITPPYIFVGSSYGAFIVRTFAYLYPEDVAGIVLVEPVHEDLLPEMKKSRTEKEWKEYIGVMDQMAEKAREGPKQEWFHYFNNSDTIRGIEFPCDIPIFVLTSTRFSEREKQMMYREEDIIKKYELHREWIKDKENITHITTDKSGHNIASREPELIINLIINLINKIKENKD